tara:strand:+ start:514 stop:879 length:366 start_codon:yes stop_codon:yes gene_type:complete
MKKNIKRLVPSESINWQNWLKSQKKTLGKESPPIDEMIIIHRSNRYMDRRTMVETCELKNESGYKFLKIWELYEPNEPSDVRFEYSKKGIVIPIKDAKKWIKKLYNHYYPTPTKSSKTTVQ